MILLFVLAACPKTEIRREIVATEPVAASEVAPVVQNDPLPGWKSGFSSQAEMKGKPEQVWSFTLDGPITEPVVGEGDLVFATADGRVYAFSTDGKRVWELKLAASGGPVLSVDSVVVGGYEGRVRWMERATGRDKTVTVAGGTIRGSVVPVDGGFAWISVDGVVSTTAGWGVETGLVPTARPAADGSTLFVSTQNRTVAAVNAKGIVWEAKLPAAAVDGPVLDDEYVYCAFASENGEPGGVVAFWRNGPKAGQEAWFFRTGFQPLAAPAVGEGVYLSDKDGSLYALSKSNGILLWKNEAYGAFSTQAVIAGKSLYVGNADGNVYRVDAFDGGTAWTASLGAPVTGQPALIGNLLVVGLANGRLVGLKP